MPTRQVTASSKTELHEKMREFVSNHSQFRPKFIKKEYNESTQTHIAHYEIDSVE